MGRRLFLLPYLVALGACAQKPAETAPDLPLVRTQQIAPTGVSDALTATGTVAARRELSLGFTTAGQIATLAVNEGDRVAKGQLLAALDGDQVSSALSAAHAEERRAAAEYKRSAALLAQGWITQARLDNARAALDAAAATVRARQFAETTSRIYAPSDGLVMARLAEPREVVAAGTPVLVLGDASGGYVLRVPLSDRDSARIALGAPARVTLEAWAAPVDGRVIEVGGRSDRATGAFQVEIGLPRLPGLRSGLIGRATITLAAPGPSDQGAPLLIPSAALFQARAGEGFVFVIDAQKTARLRKVQLGETGDEGTRVLGGLRPGERVAISGFDRLRDGVRVQLGDARR